MNKQRRADLDKARALIEEATGLIEQSAVDERDYYDNMPENLQNGEKGEAASAAADALENAQNSLEEVLGYLEEAAA